MPDDGVSTVARAVHLCVDRPVPAAVTSTGTAALPRPGRRSGLFRPVVTR
jgi:hypothetical protein